MITADGLLILLDLWFLGFTESLCLAAELSKNEENWGGESKSTDGEKIALSLLSMELSYVSFSGCSSGETGLENVSDEIYVIKEGTFSFCSLLKSSTICDICRRQLYLQRDLHTIIREIKRLNFYKLNLECSYFWNQYTSDLLKWCLYTCVFTHIF